MKCFQCAKDVVELSPDDPRRVSPHYLYTPAFVLEVLDESRAFSSMHPDDSACRATVLCWDCIHEIKPDMWLSSTGWDAGKPAVPFAQLPIYDHDAILADEPRSYAHVAVPARA